MDCEDHKHCLFTDADENMYEKQLMFQNRLHIKSIHKVNKVTLNRDDEKRVIQSDDVSMLAHRHKDSKGSPKMNERKPIHHKEFNEFMKSRGFRGRNDYTLKDLKVKFGFKPLVKRRVLVVSLEDMEPTMFGSMREATKAISVGEDIIRYVRNSGRNSIRRFGAGNIIPI